MGQATLECVVSVENVSCLYHYRGCLSATVM